MQARTTVLFLPGLNVSGGVARGIENTVCFMLHLYLLQSMYIFLHTVKGTPFETPDQGKARLLTHWEQMDYGVQFTASRKFLTITPIVL